MEVRIVLSVFTLGLFLLLLLPSVTVSQFHKGTNGGFECIGCTTIFGLMDQLAFIHKEPMSKSADRLCSFLPSSKLVKTCTVFARSMASWLNHMQSKKATPDTICQTLRICTDLKGKYCHIFPKGHSSYSLKRHIEDRKKFPVVDMMAETLIMLQEIDPNMKSFSFLCKLPLIKEICFAFKNFIKHMPIYDNDGDLYSQADTLRGAYWRGKDCDDFNAKFHPGAKPINSDIKIDTNCNGINGTDANGRPYEDIFCKNTNQRGYAVVGDSVAAHLHIPEEWFDATKISKASFKDLLLVVEDEFDWPQLSSSTGFMNTSWDIIKGSTDSLYYRLWERNHCIHRDFQNIGINGATSFSQLEFVKSLARNQTMDYPLIVSYSLVGNDICNWHTDTLEYMTTPKEMFQNTLNTMKYLDTVLPKGSYVIITGLVDGRILYNTMHNRIHPIGRTRQDVTYENFYDYFNCMELSMCSGWLTSNATLRNLTYQRMEQLNNVRQEIAAKHNHFKNFRLYYIGNIFHKMMDYWKQKGGSTWQLIEPVDGFHNNQVSQAISTEIIWETLKKEAPEILGEINPNNKKIEQIFGNQGGY